MPLLKKKPYEKAPIPLNLRASDEVFYCSATNEIFRDYEEFSERMFLCNSMVWTCSFTGKANLTYSEALECEEHAKQSLKEFPGELKIPILYLATRTKRTAFGDMAEDVFQFAKDRFFIGENIETSFTDTKWKDSHVLQVIAPPVDKIKTPAKNGNIHDNHSHPPASLYKYEIEHLDAHDKDISEIMIVDYTQMRRKKGSFSREKCKLFLKQYVKQDDGGIFIIKPSTTEAFKLDKVSFETIFDGPAPEFDATKKFGKVANGKKTRQESLHKFLTKNGSFAQNGDNADLLEKMRKKEEEFKLAEEQKKERRLLWKQKKKQEYNLLAKSIRNWHKPQEDLDLVDQKKLPQATPVRLKVPDEYVGDMLMVIEFVHTFSKLLIAKDFFTGGLTTEIMERALTENEVAGPLIDLIQMLLNALFNLQDAEAKQYTIEPENISSVKQEKNSDNMNLSGASHLATIASKWSKKYQGIPLRDLPLYSLTTSEVLRLHLLGSGAIINYTGARWRYQERGGYTSEDDPGLYLRLHSPHILKALKIHNVVELPISDKLKILSCLVNQLLTYADVRDIVEEQTEKNKQARTSYKLKVAAEKKREQEFLAAKVKLQKMIMEDSKVPRDLTRLETEAEKQKAENERKIEDLGRASYVRQICMGYDRAFRQYLKLESLPGFFVHFDGENTGTCSDNFVEQLPHLVNASRDEIIAHIKKTLQDPNSSDKENNPSEEPNHVNGVLNGVQEPKTQSSDELMLCSADPETCVIHSANKKIDRWCVCHEEDSINQLIESLNVRGFRENELAVSLKTNWEELESIISKTPVGSLTGNKTEDEKAGTTKTNKSKYESANLGYPNDMSPEDILHNVLIENILEMEEKISSGLSGTLPIKDREKWRNCLQNKNYKELDKTLAKDDDDEKKPEDSQDYQDPDQFPGSGSDLVPDIDNNDVLLTQKEEIKEAIGALSIALAQVARSVASKYLQKPLGKMNRGRSTPKKENMLGQWEQSLLASTSFSQIFLHYSTLDSCVMWARSVLWTRCRICRRRNDSENMLLCDSCNLSHHLYCLKPKLKSVPSGDWFCSKCQKKREPEVPVVAEPPRKKRPIFRDEEIDEEESEKEESGSNDENNDTDEVLEEEQDSDDEPIASKVELCKMCGSGGEVISCETCSLHYHIECVEPPLRRMPRGSWFCTNCKKTSDRKRHQDSIYVNGVVVQRTGKMNGQRRCAARALYKIHDFAKSLRQMSESDDTSEDEIISKRSTRRDRDEGRSDLPLHNSALHAVLSEIMKDYNAWPFLRPVQKTEVPDYYDVITKPMDFGTIKYKLNMGEYTEDAQFMSDALLVFQNCNTYNHTDDDVFKCGVQLLKHFQKKCRELGLKLPEEMDYDEPRPRKKIRTQ